jgi:hypothetical protein
MQYFPQVPAGENKYAVFLGEVMRRTATLMAQWQSVGTLTLLSAGCPCPLALNSCCRVCARCDEHRQLFRVGPHARLWTVRLHGVV